MLQLNRVYKTYAIPIAGNPTYPIITAHGPFISWHPWTWIILPGKSSFVSSQRFLLVVH